MATASAEAAFVTGKARATLSTSDSERRTDPEARRRDSSTAAGSSSVAGAPSPARTTEPARTPVGAGIRATAPALPVWPTAAAAAASAEAGFFASPCAAGTAPSSPEWNATTRTSAVAVAGSPDAREIVGSAVLGVAIEGPSVGLRCLRQPSAARVRAGVRAARGPLE